MGDLFRFMFLKLSIYLDLTQWYSKNTFEKYKGLRKTIKIHEGIIDKRAV